LDPEKVKIIQPERNLEQSLFTGEKTALLFLEAVQTGDIVEFACTVRGANPSGGSKMSGGVLVREYEPVERLATRLLWPRDRRIYFKNHGTDAQPVIVRKDDLTAFTWDFKKAPEVQREEPLPPGYNPLPWVQWSEYQEWSQVSQWEMTIFTNGTALSPELARQIKEWRRLPGAEAQVRAVLRFLQEEVRYQGIETGAEAYTPANPSLVFARRFGDCKDKTMLCVAILRALGIDANPVLVSTEWRQHIQDWQPTPSAFDHAIVQVSVDSQTYWLDPTAGYQRGPLAARSWPNYGRGLVLLPRTGGLAVIPECPVQPKTTVLEYAVLRALGQPSDFKVVTIADGADAEALRRRFSTTERSAIADEDLNAFATLYPGIVRAAPLEYSDDEKANEVVVAEYYQIANIWNPVPTGPGYVCRFYSYNVDRAVQKPTVSFRSMPLGLSHPGHEVFRAEIALPPFVNVDPGSWAINNPAFHFHKTVISSARKVLLEQEYDSLSDAVPVEGMAGYLEQLDQVFSLLGYSIFSY
jgi:transglutaminase-like putative cysteine protease